jgi:kynurenine/2-aminoadipate aminotransferase
VDRHDPPPHLALHRVFLLFRYWNLLYPSSNHYEKLVSFFQTDTDGRVLRFDSFSKIFAVGLRVGWVSGPPRLVEAISYDLEAGAQHASAAAQLELISTLELWGDAGFRAHVLKTQTFYEHRCKVFMAAFEKHLSPLGITMGQPDAGMFAWLNLSKVTQNDTSELVKRLAEDHKVLFVPGIAFSALQKPSRFIRAAFSTRPFPGGFTTT